MYVLSANSKDGKVYYMNVIMCTEQKECAETFATKEDAEKEVQHFKNLFFYEEPKIEIEVA